jgi:hypothetical protein
MSRFRQLHDDGSTSVLTLFSGSWRVQLVIPKPNGGCMSLVGIQAKTLEEAKWLAKRAMEKETKHLCNINCQDWEEA